MKLEKLKPLTDEYLESIGFVWHTDSDNSSSTSKSSSFSSPSSSSTGG